VSLQVWHLYLANNLLNMTYYLQQITRIKNDCYANQRQLDTVIGTRHHMHTHFEQAISLDQLSHLRFTSKFHLLRLYKQYYGRTPMQYLIERRLQVAKEFLTKGYGVTQTCFDVGFESPASFATLFKSKFGLTPIAFRKRAISTKCKR